jgi:zinc transporter ZupT
MGAITVLAISVVIHKVPVACSVGTTFLSHCKRWNDTSSLITFICFILASPLGMIVGMIVGEQEENMALITIQGLSGGTFVYLACCDLLIHEFHHHKSLKSHQKQAVNTDI